MAVDSHDTEPIAQASTGRRMMIGSNVLIATLLVVAVVVVAQIIAFKSPSHWDMTSSGNNSLSDGTQNLLNSLDAPVRLTSLYFETDLQEKDQPRYRQAVDDLLKLYEAHNRSKVSTDWINPLNDHEKFQKLQARLTELKVFADQLVPYQQAVDTFKNELDEQVRALIREEVELLQPLMAGSIGGSGGGSSVAPIENLMMKRADLVEAISERVDTLTLSTPPQYTTAIAELRNLYNDLTKMFTDIGQYGADQASKNPKLSEAEKDFLSGARSRYAMLAASLAEQVTVLQGLEPLNLEKLWLQLSPTSNPILVETGGVAMIVDFGSIWPPLNQGGASNVSFDQRAFKGEEKLTSAILRATHKEQTAVTFVRYGGPPLFMGGFMPGMPPAPYANMKLQLEDANFVVQEWDVKSSDTPPKIDPAPTRNIFVLLKPAAPKRGPMGQPSQEPPFGDSHRETIMKAIGDNGRILFMAGWYPGPFGPIPSTYEYNEYLEQNWGVKVDTEHMLIEVASTKPGEYGVARRDFWNMNQGFGVGDHDIVSGPLARQLTLPWCAPVQLLEDSKPEGVEHHRLVWLNPRDVIWGVKNIMAYQKQLEQRDYLTKEPEDLTGTFDLAVAAEKADQKIVVVSAREFASDQMAFQRRMTIGPRGLQLVHVNPGNVTLMINSLHWLNDNTAFMDIGKPIDAAILEIKNPSTIKVVKGLTIFVWPTMALAFGCMVWWTRRR